MFYVIRCPECSKFQLSSATKNFSCKFCSKTKKLSTMRIYFSSPDAPDASKALKKIKEEHSLRNDPAQGDFFSYNP